MLHLKTLMSLLNRHRKPRCIHPCTEKWQLSVTVHSELA